MKVNQPVYAMNYSGRVLKDTFSGDFLKEALLRVPLDKPFRGPVCFEQGEYLYQCKVTGDYQWFQGYEEIYYKNTKIYECYYHGGIVK